MSKDGAEFYENFTKEIFETVKGLSNDDRGDFIINTYENLYGKLRTDTVSSGVNVDMAKLREDLSHIRGIGGQRLDEIMAVIQRHLSGDTAPAQVIGRADGADDDGTES
ncbi:MAG: hypothetical protein J6N15_08710 [Ruminiclostridium sp.]|nr:hypothetical protein [Ruminiclostridium sp.]